MSISTSDLLFFFQLLSVFGLCLRSEKTARQKQTSTQETLIFFSLVAYAPARGQGVRKSWMLIIGKTLSHERGIREKGV